MTVVTTVMRGAVCTLPAMRPFLHVRTDSALIRPMSVMGTMTVKITLMSWSTCVTPQKPHAPLISSGVTEKLPLRVDCIHRLEFGEVSGHRVLIKRGPGNRGPTECGTTHEARSGMSS